MRIKLGFIVFLAPFVLFSQNGRVFNFDGGVCTNVPTDKKWNETSGAGSTSLSSWVGSTRTTYSYFLKGSLEKPITLCEKTSVSFPIGVSYRNQADAINMGGWSSGCFSSFYGNRDIIKQSHLLLASVGVKFSANLRHKFSLFVNVITLSGGLSVYSIEHYTDVEQAYNSQGEISTYRYAYETGPSQLQLNLSGGGGLMYKVNDKISLGLSNEIYFYNFDIMHPGVEKNKHLFNFGYNYHGIISNTGLHVQYKF